MARAPGRAWLRALGGPSWSLLVRPVASAHARAGRVRSRAPRKIFRHM